MVKDFLLSDKKIYDSVHGFIRYDEFEKELIDSPPFQRLHYIHQLGVTYLVYPGATHSRFEHSLGVMELATRMFKNICKFIRPDVFHFVPRKGSSEYLYWEKVLRMAALCHDLGHLPFSHVAEKELLGDQGHEKITLRLIESPYLRPIWEKLLKKPGFQSDLTGRNLIEDIAKVALGEEKLKAIRPMHFSSWERIVSSIVTGNFFGADRIDYLLRDAKCTGVAYGLFDYHQLIEMLRILPSAEPESKNFELGIDENGIESCEALLLARHFMHRRVYQYSSVKAYNFHLRRFMKAVYSAKHFENLEDFLMLSDTEAISDMARAARNRDHPGHNDAKCIINRRNRFKAISLPDNIDEAKLQELQRKEKIPQGEMEWELHISSNPIDGLNFPVSKRHLMVRKAKDTSQMLQQVPPNFHSWVYIAPEYEMAMLHALEGWLDQ